ncbi:MAG: radical SAM protein [Candidatus Methanomethylophilaceae archaeon]
MPGTTKEYANVKGLPKRVKSICPECGKILDTEYYKKDGKVYAKKKCPEHGDFDDVIWSDVEMYLKVEEYAQDGIGLLNPDDKAAVEAVEEDNVHIMIGGSRVDMISCTALANIDLTNRCNMNCPICFANANQAGYVYEPSYDEVVAMLQMLRDEKPIKCTAIQFSGGEPTIHPRFIDIIRVAKQMKFAQVQVASNGIEFAKSVDFCRAAKEAGLNTIYLSFDGVTDDVYVQARDRKMFNVKLKVLENLRKLEHPPSVVLVPTIVKGVNDHQVGDILKFAFDNSDIVRGVNYQPVAFTGRITREELDKGRFTLPDLARCMEEQTGYTNKDDWYPVPVVAPISKFASVVMGQNKVTFTAHPHCGLATYLFKDDKGNVTPIPRFIDVKRFTQELSVLADKADRSKHKKYYVLKAALLMNRCLDASKLPEGLTKRKLVSVMKNVMSDKSKKTLAEFSWKMMYVGGMHFQDSYNYDIARVERCAIHYATPDLRVIPFCAYNGGPEYRKEVEEKFSVPLAEWKEKNKKEAKDLENAMIVPEDQRPDA